MSSQHFVRDNQEAPLILTQNHRFPVEKLFEFLEWNPPVYIPEEAAELALEHNIKVDKIFCLPGNIAAIKEAFEHQQPVEVYSDKAPSAEACLQHIIKEGGGEAQIIWSAGEEAAARLIKKYKDRIRLKILTEQATIYPFYAGTFSKWLSPGATITIRPLQEAGYIVSKGFDENIKGKPEGASLLKAGKGGWVSIESEPPGIIITEHEAVLP